MGWSVDQLPEVFRRMEELLPRRRSGYRVAKANKRDLLERVIELDKLVFLPPNQLGRKKLSSLWKADKTGFYVLYREEKAIGYCDLFGLKPNSGFVDSLKRREKSDLNLPDVNDLCDSIVPRRHWSKEPIELYIDAILVSDPRSANPAAYELVRGICKDLQRYPNVYVSQIATVVVENSLQPLWSPFIADDPKRNRCHGAQLALRGGLLWGKHKILGHEPSMELGRYLYASHFGIRPKLLAWANFYFGNVFYKISQRDPHTIEKVTHTAFEVYDEFLKGH